MKFKAVIFDMGGVLLNFDFGIYIQSFREIGLSEIDRLADRYRQRGPFFEIEAGLITPAEFFDKIREKLPKPLSDREIADTWCRFLKGIPKESLEAVKAVHHKAKTYILSNSNPIHWEWVCRQYFPSPDILHEYFDECFLSYEMKMSKPDPDIFEETGRRIGFRPEDILFIDDSDENCRQAAKLGWSVLTPKENREWISFLSALSFFSPGKSY